MVRRAVPVMDPAVLTQWRAASVHNMKNGKCHQSVRHLPFA